MAIIKSFTSLEQSKKLAEILPLESADMWYQHTGISIKDGSEKPIYFPMVIRDCESDEDIPCWSLSALLSVLSDGSDIVKEQSDDKDGKYMCTVGYKNDILSTFDNNPIDACVEMIMRLNELNIL